MGQIARMPFPLHTLMAQVACMPSPLHTLMNQVARMSFPLHTIMGQVVNGKVRTIFLPKRNKAQKSIP